MVYTKSADYSMGVGADDMPAPPPLARTHWRDACRLIPSRFPPVGILDRVASPEDLPAVFELEAWTNDRVSAELRILHRLPAAEWVTGTPHATVIMAAFCHPPPGGGRFNDASRGAWYAASELATAHAEIIHHRTKEFLEVGTLEQRAQVRLYLADFDADFADLRKAAFRACLEPDNYRSGQTLARTLLDEGFNGVVYPSVRRPEGECVACFRPKLVCHVRPSAHFEYRWEGTPDPGVITLHSA